MTDVLSTEALATESYPAPRSGSRRCVHLTPGRSVLGCTLTREHATGPNSTVWDGTLNDTDVVVKVASTPTDPDDSEAAAVAILNEADAYRMLGDHDGLAHMFGADYVDGDTPAIVVERVHGPTLAEKIDEDEDNMDVRDAVRLFAQLFRTLAFIHEHQLVHRDLKPSNIVLEGAGPKIIDLANCRLCGDTNFDENGYMSGTPAYVAPEAAFGELVKPSFDVYSLGATFYKVLTGKTPFSGTDFLDICSKAMHGTPAALPLGIPVWLATLIELCLGPAATRPTAAVVANTLRNMLDYC